MKLVRFLLTFAVTVGFIVALSIRMGSIPPLGKFLDPFNGFWHNATIELDQDAEELKIPGLTDKVTITYDEFLVPHIYAQNDHDLYLAQGFITARHRLWQMDFQVQAAGGRLSEILGEGPNGAYLDFDRTQRRYGLVMAAQNSIDQISKDEKSMEVVQAFTDGVNAYIAALPYEGLPVEYKLLDYKPENWTPLKTALLLKYMANTLSGRDMDLESTNAVNVLGMEMFNKLYPDMSASDDPIIPRGTEYDFEGDRPTPPDSIYTGATTRSQMEKPHPHNGSNNWAVSGERTSTGAPLLANDPHLRLSLPSIWYVMQLSSPEANVYGATLPGAPGVIIGFNENIAWGVTNATRDVRDWYKIQFRDSSREEYKFDDQWLKTQKKIEKLLVRNGEVVYDTIIMTHLGPVTYDRTFGDSSEYNNYALRWTAHDPSNEMITFHRINRASNLEEWQEAISTFTNPAQNFVFASKEGNIALKVQGKFPIKFENQGKFLMDGSRSDMVWKGFIPAEENAMVVNPPRGFVSSANQIPVDSTYPYYVYDASYETYRNRRINNRLSELKRATPEDMMRLQLDNYNLKAAELVPAMLDTLEFSELGAEEKELVNVLRRWNFYNNANSTAASIWEVWYDKLYRLTWDEIFAQDIPMRYPSDFTTIDLLTKEPGFALFDVVETSEKETAPDLFRMSLEQAADSLANWKEKEGEEKFEWGRFKATEIRHLMRLPGMGVDYVESGGNSSIVNATSKYHGPSWRMVVSLEDSVQAWGIYPGGQSGNSGSKYYDNMVDMWAKGEYMPLYFLKPGESLSEPLYEQTLTP
ncbi:penicillin acylase family protein [Roseivirga sp. BDSF3-8]|uniref:penicillin acylase family protein n=1 Tax=Roseivirga sp. BDSF3-8 TaxID=3241598 RepID=UPI00353219F5